MLGWFLTMEGIGAHRRPRPGRLDQREGRRCAGALADRWAGRRHRVIALVPPIWAAVRDVEPVRHRLRALIGRPAKGALVFERRLPGGLRLPGDGLFLSALRRRSSPTARATAWKWRSPSMTVPTPRGRRADRRRTGQVRCPGHLLRDRPERRRAPGDRARPGARGELIGNHSYRHHKSDAVVELNYGELWKAESAISRSGRGLPGDLPAAERLSHAVAAPRCGQSRDEDGHLGRHPARLERPAARASSSAACWTRWSRGP